MSTHRFVAEYGTYGKQWIVRFGNAVIAQLGNGGLTKDMSNNTILRNRAEKFAALLNETEDCSRGHSGISID